MNPKRSKINPVYFQPIESLPNERYKFHKTKEVKDAIIQKKGNKSWL